VVVVVGEMDVVEVVVNGSRCGGNSVVVVEEVVAIVEVVEYMRW